MSFTGPSPKIPGRRSIVARSAATALAFLTLAALGQEIGNAPIKNFVLPIFTKEGPRALTLRGSEASRPSEKQIDITDFSLTRFDSDSGQKVEDILLAPSASFFPDKNFAKGDKAVRVIRDEMEINGEIWTYDHALKKVTLDKNVRVIFHAQMKDILK